MIADFLRKVLKLGLLRLADLCDRMDFDPLDRQEVLTQVYTMVQHVLYEHTHLLYNRHLDQVLLSALYGVCKVPPFTWACMTIHGIAMCRGVPEL